MVIFSSTRGRNPRESSQVSGWTFRAWPASSFFSRVSGIEFNNGKAQDTGTASCLPLFLLAASTVTVGYSNPFKGWLLIDDRPMP